MDELVRRPSRWRRVGLAVLVVACVATRVSHVLFESNFAAGVGRESEQIARNLLAGNGYSLQLPWGGSRLATAHMPPGIPFLLMTLYWLPFNDPHLVFQLLQVLAAAVSLLLVWSLGRYAFSEAAGWAAAVLFLVDLNLSFTVTWVQETALNILFVLAGLWSVVRLHERPSSSMAIVSGVLFGLGSLVRPVVLLIQLVSLIWLCWPRTPFGWRLLGKAALVVLTTFLVIAPWTLRNYMVFRRFVPICQNWAINFWLAYNPEAAGSQCDAQGNVLLPSGTLGERVRGAASELEMDRLLADSAWNYLRTNPWDALKLRPYCFLYFWLDHNYWLDRPPYHTSRLIRAANFVLVGLTGAAVVLNWRRFGPARLFIAVLIVVSLFYTVFHADIGNRFRMQIEPLMLIFVGELVITTSRALAGTIWQCSVDLARTSR